MKLNWLDRNLIKSPVFYALATSEAILEKELKRLKFKGDCGVTKGAGATTNFLTNTDGEVVALVCLFEHSHDKLQIYALLVHEAVHIFQEIRKSLSESDPSSEFEAYSIQSICQNLFYEYERQQGCKNGKRTRR